MIRFPLMIVSLRDQNRLAQLLRQHAQYRPTAHDPRLAAARFFAQQRTLARHRDQPSMDGDDPNLRRLQATRWRASFAQDRRSTAASAHSSFPWIRDLLYRQTW